VPSFVNIGAYVDEGTMVDTWAAVGSCAQIGKTCTCRAGVGIGGRARAHAGQPTIIEDNCFIGRALRDRREASSSRELGDLDGACTSRARARPILQTADGEDEGTLMAAVPVGLRSGSDAAACRKPRANDGKLPACTVRRCRQTVSVGRARTRARRRASTTCCAADGRMTTGHDAARPAHLRRADCWQALASVYLCAGVALCACLRRSARTRPRTLRVRGLAVAYAGPGIVKGLRAAATRRRGPE
jgi:hypothetical protein